MSPSTDDAGPSFVLEYRDGLDVRIELANSIDGSPEQVFAVALAETPLSKEDVAVRLEALASDERLLEAGGAGDTGVALPFALDIKRSVMSWGADGAHEQVILRLLLWSAEGIVGAVAFNAVRDTLRGLASVRRDEPRQDPLSREDALGLAEWGVARTFGLPEPMRWVEDADGSHREVRDKSLVLVEEHLDEATWRFRWRRGDFEFLAAVELVEGWATLTEYRRTRIDTLP